MTDLVNRAQRLFSILLLVSTMLLTNGCGTDSNINGFLFVPKNEKALDSLLARAQYAYDRGEFSEAKKYSERAYQLSPESERAAIQLGYVYLALAGIDSFQIARSLIDDDDEETKQETEEENTPRPSRNAASTLAEFSSILGISESDVLVLGDMQNSEQEAFSDFPVIYPFSSKVSRQESGLENLLYLERAVSVVCPFVDREVLQPNDYRHQGESCRETQYARLNRAKSHFLWAFSHLADAVAFNRVVLFTSDDRDKANLELRSQVIDDVDVVTYLNLAGELASDLDNIMNVSDPDSALNAVLNSLSASEQALLRLEGLTPSATVKLARALDSIRNPLVPPPDTENPEAAVLKGQLNRQVSGELAKKIDKLSEEDPGDFEGQRSEICATFESISQGQGGQPEACKD